MTPVDTVSLRKIQPLSEQYNQAMKAFTQARTELSRDLQGWLDEHGITKTYVAEQLNSTVANIVRSLSGARPFHLSADKVARFSYQIMNKSCHELLFGRKQAAMLSKPLSAAVELLMTFPKEKSTNLMSFLRDTVWDKNQNWDLTNRDPLYRSKSAQVRFAEQITELSQDRLLIPGRLNGEVVPTTFRHSLLKYLNLTKDASTSSSAPRLNFLMFCSLYFDVAIDQFLAENYMEYADVRLYDSNEIVRDPEILDFLSHYIVLPKEDQDEVYRHLMYLALTDQ